MCLTETQTTQYHSDGYTVVRALIAQDDAARVRERLMQLLAGEIDWPVHYLQALDPARYRTATGTVVPLGVQLPAQQEETFSVIADHPRLQAAMAQLLGGPVRRFTDQALIKNRDVDGETFYHQDSYYWHVRPERGCNAWIALDEVGPGASALAMLPGSHRSWTLTPHEQYFDEPTLHSAKTGTAFHRHRIPRDQVDLSAEVLLPMSPGDAAFFTNYTWHRAEPNRSGRHICAYAIAYTLCDE